jgi:hypothetical protein
VISGRREKNIKADVILPLVQYLPPFISRYFEETIATFTSSEYYKKLPHQSTMATSLWFAVSMTILSWLVLGWSALVEKPQLFRWYDFAVEEAGVHFPTNQVISWTGQELKLSQAVPLTIYFPAGVLKRELDLPERLAVVFPEVINESEFATKLPTTALMVATPTTLFIHDSAGGWRKFEWNTLLSQTPSFSISKESVVDQLKSFKPVLERTFYLMMGVGMILLPLLLGGYYALSALMDALLAYALFWIAGTTLSFSSLYKISLHLSLVAGVISTLSMWMYGVGSLPLYGLVYWIGLSYLAYLNRNLWFNFESLPE